MFSEQQERRRILGGELNELTGFLISALWIFATPVTFQVAELKPGLLHWYWSSPTFHLSLEAYISPKKKKVLCRVYYGIRGPVGSW